MKNLYLVLIFISAVQLESVSAYSCNTQPGICWAVGDPHIRRFDGNHHLFSTTGKVLVISDRKSVWVRMALKNTGRATQIVNVFIDYIYQDGSKYGKRTNIVFETDEEHVKINYKVRPLPYEKWGIKVTPVRFGTLVDAGGIHIKWLNSARLFVTMGTEYVGKVDGECGTYCMKPPGRGYSSSKRNRGSAALRLDKPYKDDYSNINSQEFQDLATQVENSIRTLYDPTFIGVTVTGAKKGSTVVLCNITLEEDDRLPAVNVQEEIQKKMVEGKDKNRHTLAELLGEKVLDCKVSEMEVEMSENDYDVEPAIAAGDEEDEEEEDHSMQGQGSPYFGNSQNHPTHSGNHEEHPPAHAPAHHAPPRAPPVQITTTPASTDCAHNGWEYNHGSTIEQSYGTCTCNKGKWECQNGFGICGIWGEDDMETFDEKHLKLDGECKYFMLTDCGHHPPRYTVSSVERYECTENIKQKKRALLLTVGNDSMRIGTPDIAYNREYVHPPRNLSTANGGVIEITENDKKVKIMLNDELMIEWDRALYYGITLRRPDSHNSTCGLCGNFNGDADDDVKLPEHEGHCWEKHPGCLKKDADFEYPKQVYNVSCDDIEKVEFPVYHGEGCKQIKLQLLSQCQTCVAGIPKVCLHPSNLGCIKQKEKTCVTDLFAHFLRSCYTQVFTAAAAAGGGGKRKKRDLRAIQLKDAIGSIDLDKMSIDDINTLLKK